MRSPSCISSEYINVPPVGRPRPRLETQAIVTGVPAPRAPTNRAGVKAAGNVTPGRFRNVSVLAATSSLARRFRITPMVAADADADAGDAIFASAPPGGMA